MPFRFSENGDAVVSVTGRDLGVAASPKAGLQRRDSYTGLLDFLPRGDVVRQ